MGHWEKLSEDLNKKCPIQMKKAIISNIGMDNLQWTMDNDFIVEIGCIAMDNIFYSLKFIKRSIVINLKL